MIKFYCINLKHRNDRLDRFFSLNKNKINSDIHVIEAIDGNEINIKNYIDKINSLDYLVAKQQLPGVLGCCLSHFKVFQDMIDNNIQYAIIMEDDVLINENLSNINPLINQAIMMNVDLMYFNYPFPKETYVKSNNPKYHFQPYDGKLHTAEMYLISLNYVKLILNEFKDDLGAFDIILRKNILKNGGKIIVLDPPIADQFDRNDSNIR